MPDINYSSLIYLVLLGSAIAFWFFVENRQSLGRVLRQMAAWVLIFIAVIAAYGLWGDIRQTVLPRQAVFAEQGRIALPRQADGHYYVTLDVNSVPVNFVVDTGASGVVLTQRDAARAGLKTDDLAYFSQAMTANGSVQTAPVVLDSVTLGPFKDTRIPAYVNGGEMDRSLLGMTYLQRFSRIEIANGQLVLER